MTPTQRTLKLLRDQGWTAEIVERWNQYARIRQDFAGFADILAFNSRASRGVLAVQTTSGTNLAARRAKILASEKAREWLAAGNFITLHGWRKLKPRGVKVPKWDCRVEPLEIADFQPLTEGAQA